MCAQQLKMHAMIIVRVRLRVYNTGVCPEHQGVFLARKVWPHASQMCCDAPPFLGGDTPMLSFLFCLRGGSGVEEGLEAIHTFLGSLESKVSLEEIPQ